MTRVVSVDDGLLGDLCSGCEDAHGWGKMVVTAEDQHGYPTVFRIWGAECFTREAALGSFPAMASDFLGVA